MSHRAPEFDVAAFADQVVRLRDELRPKLPGIDPGDLLLICQSLLRPFGTGKRFFLRAAPGGRFVF